MSGGVDSAVAALLCARAGGEVAAVTLELWADPDNDGERSCCSAQAVRGARALAHRMGLPHLTLDLRERVPRRRRRARSSPTTPPVADAQPVRALQRARAARRDARRSPTALGADALATGHYARVADGEGPVLRVAADPAKDQSYMLAALAPATLARLRFPLGELTKPEVRALAAEAGLPVAASPTPRTSASSPAPSRAAFLRRHGGLRERPGRHRRRARPACSAATAATTASRSASAAGSAWAAAEPLYVLETDAAARTASSSGRVRRC